MHEEDKKTIEILKEKDTLILIFLVVSLVFIGLSIKYLNWLNC